MRHVVQFSGGLCSFWAAHRVIQKHGRENVTLLFADTKMEDEDLYRFNRDAEEVLGVKITVLTDGRNPWELFQSQNMISNSKLAVCSRVLKRKQLDQWRKTNTTPEDSTFYLGMDWTEDHRMNGVGGKPGMVQIFRPWRVEAPMIVEPVWDKCRMQKEWLALGYKLPRLYEMGFPHNNCGGFCVKAGHAHFAHLLAKMPERYAFHEAQEKAMRLRVGDHSVMNDRSGDGKKKSFTLEKLRVMIEAGIRDYDTEDWGGCGCSVELRDPRDDI